MTTAYIIALWVLVGWFFLFLVKLVEDDKIKLRTYEDLAFAITRLSLFTALGPISFILPMIIMGENHKWKRKKLPWIKDKDE